MLVPLYLDDGELHAVFTSRREDLRRHAGEISFPGGRYDEGEPDLRATALREADEEIGLPAEAVEILGALQPTPTIATGYAVYPFVGLIEPGRHVDAQRTRGGRGDRALARASSWPATGGGGWSAVACRSAPTPTSSARTSSGARRLGSSPTCSTGSSRCSARRPVETSRRSGHASDRVASAASTPLVRRARVGVEQHVRDPRSSATGAHPGRAGGERVRRTVPRALVDDPADRRVDAASSAASRAACRAARAASSAPPRRAEQHTGHAHVLERRRDRRDPIGIAEHGLDARRLERGQPLRIAGSCPVPRGPRPQLARERAAHGSRNR